jgi:hypothetical protein
MILLLPLLGTPEPIPALAAPAPLVQQHEPEPASAVPS